MSNPADIAVLDRIRAEYLEMPGMSLRVAQVARLCGVEEAACQLILDALVEARFLRLKGDGTYARLGDHSLPRARAANVHVESFGRRG